MSGCNEVRRASRYTPSKNVAPVFIEHCRRSRRGGGAAQTGMQLWVAGFALVDPTYVRTYALTDSMTCWVTDSFTYRPTHWLIYLLTDLSTNLVTDNQFALTRFIIYLVVDQALTGRDAGRRRGEGPPRPRSTAQVQCDVSCSKCIVLRAFLLHLVFV